MPSASDFPDCHAVVVENNGNVSVKVRDRVVRRFKVVKALQGKPLHDRARFVVTKSMNAIAESFGGAWNEYFEEEFNIVFNLDLVIQDSEAELAVASVIDALSNWLDEFPYILEVDDLSERWEALTKGNVACDVGIVSPAFSDCAQLEAAVRLKHEASLRELVLEVARERALEEAGPEETRWLPSLVAVPFESIDNQRGISDKFRAALVAFESVVRFLVAVSIAPVHGDTSRDRLARLKNDIGKPRPTTGDYVGLLRLRIEALRGLMPNTIAALQSKAGKKSGLGRFLFDDFTNMRNRLHAHGGVPMPESSYVEPYQELREHLEAFLKVLGDDTHFLPLIVRTDMDFADGSSYAYTVRELRGASVGLPSQKLTTPHRLDSDTVYLWAVKAAEFIAMDPLVRYATCPQCGFEEAFLLDHFDPKRPRWVSPRANHTIS